MNLTGRLTCKGAAILNAVELEHPSEITASWVFARRVLLDKEHAGMLSRDRARLVCTRSTAVTSVWTALELCSQLMQGQVRMVLKQVLIFSHSSNLFEILASSLL